MGAKGQSSQTSTQTYTPNPAITAAGNQALTGAEAAANQPFQVPVAPVAGFNPFQMQGFGETLGAQGMAQPYFQTGANYLTGSAAPVTGQDVAQYYNPMAGNVMANLQDVFGQQMTQATGSATQQAGGTGADRIAVAQANLAKQQGLAAGQTMSGLYQQALQGAEQQKQMMAGAGFGLGQMGPAAQASQLQGIQALMGAGGLQQQLTQAQMNAPYQNELARIGYQFQTPQYLAGIAGGLAPAMGGTTAGQATYTPAQASPFAQMLGVGTSIAGLGGSMKGGAGGLGSYGGLGAMSGATDAAGMFGSMGDAASLASFAPFLLKRGGRAYADGGGTQDDPMSSIPGMTVMGAPGISIPQTGGMTPVPSVKGQSGPMGIYGSGRHPSGMYYAGQLDMRPPKDDSGSSGTSDIGKSVSTIAEMLPMLMAARGGGVDIMDAGQSFQEGGAPDIYSDIDPPPSREAGDPWAVSGRPPALQGISPMDVLAPVNKDSPFNVGRYVAPQAATVPPPAPDVAATTGQGAAESPISGPIPLPPSRPPMAAAPAAPMAPQAPVARPQPHPAMGPMGAQPTDYGAPQARTPYPDALDRNWGQNLTRSPWMALVKAGAAMASTPGPIGTVIGKGIAAGAGELEGQRKALQSEEDINLKADKLYQEAQQHLDKYRRMTPYEAAEVGLRQKSQNLRERMAEGLPPSVYNKIVGSVAQHPELVTREQQQAWVDQQLAQARNTLGRQGGTQEGFGAGSTSTGATKDDPLPYVPGTTKRKSGLFYRLPTGEVRPSNVDD